MSELLLLTNAPEPPREVLPAISLLLHTVRDAPAEPGSLTGSPGVDAVLVDARRDLVQARELCRLLRAVGPQVPVLAIMTEGGLAAVTAEWGADDVVLHTAGPAEIEARLRLAMGRQASLAPQAPDEIRSGDLTIDEATYTARLRARALDLTFKEFELLKFLAQHPGRVFTRSHLLQEVWGYDYFGGTRTVDVHVRRLRAKLGPEHEALIGTVRNVGYRFVPMKLGGEESRLPRRLDEPPQGDSGPGAADGAAVLDGFPGAAAAAGSGDPVDSGDSAGSRPGNGPAAPGRPGGTGARARRDASPAPRPGGGDGARGDAAATAAAARTQPRGASPARADR